MTATEAHPVAGLGRRCLSLVYEALMLVAVAIVAGLIYQAVFGPLHDAWGQTAFQWAAIGLYFVPQWKRKGRVQVDHRQLGAWYRTLDVLIRAKDQVEVALYHRLRDLFSLQPDLVLFDITSTYFEGAGPEDFAKHGYSRDGKPQNVQVVVGLVMVAGWPIAHHVWEGNRLDSTTVQEVIEDLQTRFSFTRVLFVGDRGMVSEDNLEALKREGHGYLVGLKRRRNAERARINWMFTIDRARLKLRRAYPVPAHQEPAQAAA